MTDDSPRFKLSLLLAPIAATVDVEDPTLITDNLVNQAWDMMNAFIMDILDDLELEDITDERFREIFIELCFKLAYREMTTLRLLPVWEQNFKERLASGKRIQRLPRRKGDS